MKKQLRQIKIAAVALLILMVATALLLYGEQGKAAEADATPQSYTITDMSVAEVAAVAVKNSSAAFGLIVDKQQIIMEPPDGVSYSQPELRAFIYSLCHLTGSRRISDVSELGEYGLDAPAASVAMIMADGKNVRILLGAESPLDQSRYICFEGERDVFLIGAEQAGYMLRTPRDFAERGIFPISGVDELDKLEKISVRYADGIGRDFTLKSSGDMRFTLIEPLESRLNTMTVVTGLLLPTLALYPDEVVSTDANKADFGLDRPDYELEITIDGTAYTCLIKRQPDGGYIMCEKSGKIIYGIVAESVSFLNKDYIELFGGAAYYQNPTELSSVSVRFGQTEMQLDLVTGENDEMTGTGSGKTYSSAEISVLIDALCGVRIASEVAQTQGQGQPQEQEQPQEQPQEQTQAQEQPQEQTQAQEQPQEQTQALSDITIIFTEKSGSTRTIGLSAPVNGFCTVSENGRVNFTTTEVYTKAVKSAVETINSKGE